MFQTGKITGKVKADLMGEISGIAASRVNEGVLWVHNDSGDTARIFAIDHNGKHLGTFSLKGAQAFDYEDMAVGPGPKPGTNYIFVADTGNNSAHKGKPRPHVSIYRVPEPVVAGKEEPQQVSLDGVNQFTFTYPDGAHDVETMMVDPIGGDIYLCTKRDEKSRIYRIASPGLQSSRVVAEFVGEMVQSKPVGGDVSPNGKTILIKGYFTIHAFHRDLEMPLWKALTTTDPIMLPVYLAEPQCTSICRTCQVQRQQVENTVISPPLK